MLNFVFSMVLVSNLVINRLRMLLCTNHNLEKICVSAALLSAKTKDLLGWSHSRIGAPYFQNVLGNLVVGINSKSLTM